MEDIRGGGGSDIRGRGGNITGGNISGGRSSTSSSSSSSLPTLGSTSFVTTFVEGQRSRNRISNMNDDQIEGSHLFFILKFITM
jgi:hypothetical protein